MHTQSDVFFFVHHANIKKNDKNKINKHKEYSKAGTPFAWVKRLNKQRAEQNKQGPACFISGGTLFYEFAGFCNLLQTGFLISKCAVEHRNAHFPSPRLVSPSVKLAGANKRVITSAR